jgi:hypothetical protein
VTHCDHYLPILIPFVPTFFFTTNENLPCHDAAQFLLPSRASSGSHKVVLLHPGCFRCRPLRARQGEQLPFPRREELALLNPSLLRIPTKASRGSPLSHR